MLVIKAWIAFRPAVQRNCLSTIHRSNGGELVQYSTDRMSDPASFLIFNVLLFYTDMLFYFHFHFNLLLLLLLPFLLFSSCLQWHCFMAIIQQQRSSVHFFFVNGKKNRKEKLQLVECLFTNSVNISRRHGTSLQQQLDIFPDFQTFNFFQLERRCSRLIKSILFYDLQSVRFVHFNRSFRHSWGGHVKVAWAWACRDVTDALIDRL